MNLSVAPACPPSHRSYSLINSPRPCFPLLGLIGWLLFTLPFVGLTALAGTSVSPDAAELQYTGRIDFSNRTAPALSWSASSIAASFTGSSVAIVLDDSNGTNSFNAFIDGNLAQPVVLHLSKGEKIYPVADKLTGERHQLLLTKRTEGVQGATVFRGLVLADSAHLLPPPPRLPHKMEIFGDSITCGMGNEAADGASDSNPREENSFLTYGAIAARDLHAELHLISQSGIGIMVSWFDFIMPQYYDQLSAVGNNDTQWDFSQWIPEVVVINLFQNDKWLVDREKRLTPLPTDEQRIAAYLNFVKTVRGKYPKAQIICALGSMDATEEGSKWPDYITAAVERMKKENPGDKIDTLFFEFTGYGAHPRVRHHQANAAKLSAFIREKMGW